MPSSDKVGIADSADKNPDEEIEDGESFDSLEFDIPKIEGAPDGQNAMELSRSR